MQRKRAIIHFNDARWHEASVAEEKDPDYDVETATGVRSEFFPNGISKRFIIQIRFPLLITHSSAGKESERIEREFASDSGD